MVGVGHDYCWDGEVGSYAQILERVVPSGVYSATLDGVTRDFAIASRSDYEAALRAGSRLESDMSLDHEPELVAAVQAHWHASGSNGCRFAMYLSEHRERFGWETWVMASRDTAAGTAEAIAKLALERIDDVAVDVLSFVLPHVNTPAVLGEISGCLGDRDGWRLAQGRDATDDTIELLGLSVGIDLGFWSEILGFGQGEPLAYTRRAPFTELAIRAKPPRTARTNKRAFMADVPLDDSVAFGQWGKETKRARAQRLGNDHDARGKAKWTTVVKRPTGG